MKFPLENNPLELLGKKQGTVVLLLLLLALAIFLLPSGGDGDKENTADLESKTAELCSLVSGVGECRVMLTYRDDEVYAVAVVCEGANSTSVRRDVTELISSLFGIGANRVQILLLE